MGARAKRATRNISATAERRVFIVSLVMVVLGVAAFCYIAAGGGIFSREVEELSRHSVGFSKRILAGAIRWPTLKLQGPGTLRVVTFYCGQSRFLIHEKTAGSE